MALGWGMPKKGAPFAPCFFIEARPKQGGPGEKRGFPTLSARFRAQGKCFASSHLDPKPRLSPGGEQPLPTLPWLSGPGHISILQTPIHGGRDSDNICGAP